MGEMSDRTKWWCLAVFLAMAGIFAVAYTAGRAWGDDCPLWSPVAGAIGFVMAVTAGCGVVYDWPPELARIPPVHVLVKSPYFTYAWTAIFLLLALASTATHGYRGSLRWAAFFGTVAGAHVICLFYAAASHKERINGYRKAAEDHRNRARRGANQAALNAILAIDPAAVASITARASAATRALANAISTPPAGPRPVGSIGVESDPALYIETVKGIRTLTVHGVLPMLCSRGGAAAWPTDRALEALHLRVTINWGSIGWDVAAVEHPDTPPPAVDCDCGIYALTDPSAYLSYVPAQIDSECTAVMVSVEGWGRVIVGEKGWRAQRARVTSIYAPMHAPRGYVARMREVADVYGMPLIREYQEFVGMLGRSTTPSLKEG